MNESAPGPRALPRIELMLCPGTLPSAPEEIQRMFDEY